jgi:hypothetical protein
MRFPRRFISSKNISPVSRRRFLSYTLQNPLVKKTCEIFSISPYSVFLAGLQYTTKNLELSTNNRHSTHVHRTPNLFNLLCSVVGFNPNFAAAPSFP